MKHTGSQWIRIALVVGIASLAPFSAADRRACVIDGAAIPVEADETIGGLVEASVEGGRKIKTNPSEIELTYFSAGTVDFLFQRECARLELDQVGKKQLSNGQHQDADCAAIRALGSSKREVEAIARDLELALDEGFWPASMGPESRPLDLESCL